MKSNIINIEFLDFKSKGIILLMQYDKGQIFKFDVDFPSGTEIQFDNGMTKVISNKQVTIPNDILKASGRRKAWIQVIESSNETTVYEISFLVHSKTKPNDYVEPDDEQSFREEVQSMVNAKQNTLVSGTNIKTINNQSILGAGNITISGGGSGTTNYSELSNKPKINNIELNGNKSLSDLGINNLSTSDVDSRVQSYWNNHKDELKGDKGEKGDKGDNGKDGKDGVNGTNGSDYTITDSDYDAIATVVLGKLDVAESEVF